MQLVMTPRKSPAPRSPTPKSTETRPISESYRAIYEVVRKIPRGRVATYGQVAELAGLKGHARQVGYALHNLPEGSNVPWQRVVNAAGRVSPRAWSGSEIQQQILLEEEGVVFDSGGRLDLETYRWKPRRRSRQA